MTRRARCSTPGRWAIPLTVWTDSPTSPSLRRWTGRPVKLQAAFYERHGWRGLRTLQRLVAEARAAGLLVIVDAKRGDVGSTNHAYAEAFLGAGAPLEADALTVHPYLGLAAMGPFVTRAHESGCCLLVVTRSSNPEGRVIQSARTDAGHRVEDDLLVAIGEWNHRLVPDEIGPIGAVVGPPGRRSTRPVGSTQAVLSPGVGAQGATPADIARVFGDCPDRVMPSASRSLLEGGPNVTRLRDAAHRPGRRDQRRPRSVGRGRRGSPSSAGEAGPGLGPELGRRFLRSMDPTTSRYRAILR